MFYITSNILFDILLEPCKTILKDCNLSNLALQIQNSFISAQIQSSNLSIKQRFIRFIYKLFVRYITWKDLHIKDKISRWLTSLDFYTVLLSNEDIVDNLNYGTLFTEELYKYYNDNETTIKGATKNDKLYHILHDIDLVKMLVNRAIMQYVAHIIGIINKIMLDNVKYLFGNHDLELLELAHVYHKDLYINSLDIYAIDSYDAKYVNNQVIQFSHLMTKSYIQRNSPVETFIALMSNFINITYTHEIVTKRLNNMKNTEEYERIFNPITHYVWNKVIASLTILAKYSTSKDDWFIINLSPHVKLNSEEKKIKSYFSNDIKGSLYYMIERYAEYVKSMPEFEKLYKMRKNDAIKLKANTINDLLTEMQYYFELDNLMWDMMKV